MAVLLVMLHHFIRSYDLQSSTHEFFLHASEFMWSGVDLFFVLSGFLITGILLDRLNGKHYFRNFYGRRILRIFPLYYGVLFLAFIILPLVHIQTSSATQQSAKYFLTFTSNIQFALSGWTYHAFDPYWSLAVEEQFYLLWPLLLFLIPRKYHLSVVMMCVIGGIALRAMCIHAGTSSVFLFTMLPCHADGLLIGGALAMLVRSQTKLPIPGSWMSIALSAVVAMFFLSGSFHWFGLKLYYDAWNTRGALFYYPTIALGYGIILYLCITRSNPVRSFFNNTQLRAVGKYSYCLYLIHMPITHLFHAGIQPILLERLSNSLPAFAQELIQFMPLFLISFVCAAASWRFFERPLLRLKRYLPYSADESSQPTPVTAIA